MIHLVFILLATLLPTPLYAKPQPTTDSAIIPPVNGKCILKQVFPLSPSSVPLAAKSVYINGKLACKVTFLQMPEQPDLQNRNHKSRPPFPSI